MPEPGSSALVAILPAAGVLLDLAAEVDPGLVRPGLPPHTSLSWPFLPADALTDEVDAALGGLAAAHPRVDLDLCEVVTAPGFVGVAAPELQPLADAIADRWPQAVPYGGRFGPRPPVHLTVALGGTDAARARVADEVSAVLPLRAAVDAFHLAVLTDAGWRLRASHPLAPAASLEGHGDLRG